MGWMHKVLRQRWRGRFWLEVEDLLPEPPDHVEGGGHEGHGGDQGAPPLSQQQQGVPLQEASVPPQQAGAPLPMPAAPSGDASCSTGRAPASSSGVAAELSSASAGPAAPPVATAFNLAGPQADEIGGEPR